MNPSAGTIRTATPSSVREVNRSILLGLLRRYQPLSRAELARTTGFFRSSVSDIVDSLIAEDLVVETKHLSSGRGRAPIGLHLNDESYPVLGLTIRPKFCQLAYAGLTGHIQRTWNFETPVYSRKVLMAIALLFDLACSGILYAQSDAGFMVGFVRDPAGAIVVGAKVTVTNEGTNEDHPVVTDAQGHYTVTNLLPGPYSVSVESPGFKRFVTVHNKLDASSTLSLDASLEIGAASQSVEVTATASVLQTDQAHLRRTSLRSKYNGRNPLYMASLVPGIRSGSTLGDFNFSLSNGGYNVNGTRQNDTLITMDGAPSTLPAVTPPVSVFQTLTLQKRFRYSRHRMPPNTAARAVVRFAS